MQRLPFLNDYWDATAKLGMVFETAGMKGREFDAYCQAQGLLPVQVLAWRRAFTELDYQQGIIGRVVREAEQADYHPRGHGRSFKENALAKAAALLGD
jgi:hypothetical protein